MARVLKDHWQLFVAVALIFALWQTALVTPLKILVVFLHELSHGLAAVLTGGQIDELSISAQQGGHALTRGGSGFAIYSAGYLGSLVLGVGLWLVGLHTRADKAALALCGVVMLVVAALYVRDLFALFFCLTTGAAMLAAARYLPARVCDVILQVIGLTSMIYVPYDIFSDTIARSDLPSDARLLAEHVGGPTLFWGILWLAISLLVIAGALRFALSRARTASSLRA